MGKVSGKTHTKAQLDHWANLHNPNNKAYQADADNRAKYIFDYDDGDFAMSISDSMAMDSDGNLMMRMGDHMAMDMDTGDIHMISSWSDDDEE